MNGIDAVVLATGNDFRAVEAGFMPTPQNQVNTLVITCSNRKGIFKFWLEIPLALGTVGGLTSIH
jgi:hydroxymethylglutaryl-CoA reductase